MSRPVRVGRAFRGFTMLELLVAVIAGTLVAMAAFGFAKASTRNFSQESRLAAAGAAVTQGFRRLTNDIQRAGYQSSAHLRRDYRFKRTGVCEDPSTSVAGIANLQSILVEPHGTYAPTGTASPATNLMVADRLTLSGMYSLNDLLDIKAVQTAGGVITVTLDTETRAFREYMGPVQSAARLAEAFRPGRIARIYDANSGFSHYGVVAGSNLGAGTAQVLLSAISRVMIKGTGFAGATREGGESCGLDQSGAGNRFIGVVNRYRYEVRDLRNDPSYALLYPASIDLGLGATVTTGAQEAGRMELVRTELDVQGTPMGSNELIAEYAVRLRFGGTVDTAQPPAANSDLRYQPSVSRLDIGNPLFYPYVASVAGGGQLSPGRVKALGVMFAVRSREFDRRNALPNPVTPQNLPGGIYRYEYPLNSGNFARVRTLQADVALSNQLAEFR
ncbi:MAG: prepilin-type N-terminal cleavage/methylation domain-containing protein [Polyangiaceae bacterium]|nr:prepilin-type N-terminal cleavage/methylation domain-containing protein [Polyangiaceae bacterium]